jgi:hypothetical protein
MPWRGFTILAVAAIAFIASISVWFALDERSRWLFTQRTGTISSGCALRVCIGDGEREATGKLSRLGLSGPILEFDQNLATLTRKKEFMRDDGWRNGVIALTIENGKVARIAWVYSGPFRVDM